MGDNDKGLTNIIVLHQFGVKMCKPQINANILFRQTEKRKQKFDFLNHYKECRVKSHLNSRNPKLHLMIFKNMSFKKESDLWSV